MKKQEEIGGGGGGRAWRTELTCSAFHSHPPATRLTYREQGMRLQNGGFLVRGKKEVNTKLAKVGIILNPPFGRLVVVPVFRLSIISLSRNEPLRRKALQKSSLRYSSLRKKGAILERRHISGALR